MIVCGIDPGMGGALAVISNGTYCGKPISWVIDTCCMPTMGEKTKRLVDGNAVRRFIVERDVEFVVIEQVGAMPGQGTASMFRFGVAFGQVIGIIQGLGLPHAFVTPQTWKKAMGLSKDKTLSRRRAIERLPGAAEQFQRVKDADRAEAALLALYWLSKEPPCPKPSTPSSSSCMPQA